ncbi:MAG: NADH-quinone oxidoreductase subunit A [Anaerolineae bacterium]|nr:NADH-quinone oxidoreductase subunit A [Anaerolineae bacterium]
MIEIYLPIVVLLVISVALSVVILFFSRIFGPFRPNRRKLTPYESGMTPIGPAQRRIPVKFYLVAVLFIIFDIEVIFILPWAVVFRDLGAVALVGMAVFIVILLIAFIYEWKKGAMVWE